MNNISILLLFNIIIIYLSYNFKKNIIIYPFIFIFLITLYVQLIYNKNIEGFINNDNEMRKQVYSFWDRLNDETLEEDNRNLIDKINIFLKKFISFEKTS